MLSAEKILELKLKANEIRKETVKTIASIGVGHIGGSLSIADVMAVLYFDEMKVDPKNPKWDGRDWLVVSKGHSGPAVYTIVLEELGNMAMEQQDYTQALAYYQNGLATKSPVNEQKLRRGEIAALEQMYDFEQAKEKMSQYVLDYPDDEEAAREYLFLKTRTAVADQIEEEQQAQTQGTVEIENSEESTGEDSAEGETNA